MFGLDDWIAHFSDGATLAVIAGVAILLGLRHATDPDHLAAVTTLIASGKERTKTAAARLGLSWGLGHATSLFVFGLPIVLFKAYLPEPVAAGRRDGRRLPDRRAGRLAARALAPRRLPPPRAHPRRVAATRICTTTRRPTATPCEPARRCRRMGSGSSTAWAEALVSAFSSSRRSTAG